MKLVVISDTHMYPLKEILAGYLNPEATLVHCGDFLNKGDLKEWLKVEQEIKEIAKSFKHVVIVFGNHDIYCEKSYHLIKEEFKGTNVHFLWDSLICLDEKLIYGSPWVPYINGRWAFESSDKTFLLDKWSRIPDNLDLLVTHTPPRQILDQSYYGDANYGCKQLAKVIFEKKPACSTFGHCHSGYGEMEFNGIRFVNASICTEFYKPTNSPRVLEI